MANSMAELKLADDKKLEIARLNEKVFSLQEEIENVKQSHELESLAWLKEREQYEVNVNKANEELKLIKSLLLLKNVEVHADLSHVMLS